VSFLSIWVALLACHFGAAPAEGQQFGDREYTLKAVYLYKFATYIRWPEHAFASGSSPFVFGIVGPDPVGPGLRKLAAAKTIGDRRIEVHSFEHVHAIRDCHVLFITRAVPIETQQAAIKQLSGQSILLVGEIPEFLDEGGGVRFAVRENRIEIIFSREAYQRERLEVSSQLLRIANVQ
jgi:YfiR/HmsC-like